MANTELALTPETEGRLWSVKTWNGTYLIARRMDDQYDIHKLEVSSAGVSIEWIGEASGQISALQAIEQDLEVS